MSEYYLLNKDSARCGWSVGRSVRQPPGFRTLCRWKSSTTVFSNLLTLQNTLQFSLIWRSFHFHLLGEASSSISVWGKRNANKHARAVWTHLITPSRNFVEVRWRSLFRSTSLGKRCTSYNAPPTSRKRAADLWSLRNFLPRSSFFVVRKTQKSHVARSELNSLFGLENVNRWNPISTSAIHRVVVTVCLLICSSDWLPLFNGPRRVTFVFPEYRNKFPKHEPSFYSGQLISVQLLFAEVLNNFRRLYNHKTSVPSQSVTGCAHQ
jgi:hypothetical protein